jgi:predicted AAA+ superfamily ATPase
MVADPALALRLARVKPASLGPLSGQFLGPALEGFVAGELAKQRGWSAIGFDLYHYRSSGGVEVDLVVELEDGRLYGIEVKATQSVLAGHVKNLRLWAARLGERFAGGVVLSLAARAGSHGGGIWSLPLETLWRQPAV